MNLIKSGLIIFLFKVVKGELYITFNGKDISVLSEPVKIIEGEDLLFECRSSHSDSTFIWTKDGADSTFGITKEVKQIQVEDAGAYNCQAIRYNKTSATEIAENKHMLVEVLYPPSYPTVQPVFIKGPYYALHGEKISLICQSDANPKPNYQWRRSTKDGSVLTRNATYNMIVESYIIDYYCIVQNRMVPTVGEPKTTTLTYKQQIRVYVKAYINEIKEGRYRNVNEGDIIIASCTAYGRPPPKIWWTKEGDKSFYLENYKLVQTSVTKAFAGKYFCNVENTVIASNQTRIKTHVEQEVQITVHTKSKNNAEFDIKSDNCSNEDGGRSGDVNEKNDPKNIALLIVTGIGWLGFVLSMVLHLIICTKNRNKKSIKAPGNQSTVDIANNGSLSTTQSYMSNVRIPGDIYSNVYDQLSAGSLSEKGSLSCDSDLTMMSTVPSFESIPQTSSNTYLHPLEPES